MAGRLDRVDLKMLRLLQNSGRLTNAELAEMVGVSAATCHRRTQRLFDEGYVSQVRAMVAPRKVGKGALVMVGVVLDRSTPESFAAFERAIAQLKFVLDCHLVDGGGMQIGGLLHQHQLADDRHCGNHEADAKARGQRLGEAAGIDGARLLDVSAVAGDIERRLERIERGLEELTESSRSARRKK